MDFLKADRFYHTPDQYRVYLSTFLEEGDKYNGINLLLGNFFKEKSSSSSSEYNHDDDDDIAVFSHNQEEAVTATHPKFEIITTDNKETHSFSNGRCGEHWHKQTLGCRLMDRACEIAD